MTIVHARRWSAIYQKVRDIEEKKHSQARGSMGRGRGDSFMTKIPSRLVMSAKEREDAKISIKEKLSEEKGSADNKLGDPYITERYVEGRMSTRTVAEI